jgi:hypothetical protein
MWSADFFPLNLRIIICPPLTPEELLAIYTLPGDGNAHMDFVWQQNSFVPYPVQLGGRSCGKNPYLSFFDQGMDIDTERLGYTRMKINSILVGGGTSTYFSFDEHYRGLFSPKINTLNKHGLLTQDEEKIKLVFLIAFFADDVAQPCQHLEHIPFFTLDYGDENWNLCHYSEIFGGGEL